MVPADSRRVSRVPRYSGATRKDKCIFMYGAVTLCGRPFQSRSINTLISLFTQTDFTRLAARAACLCLWSYDPELSLRIVRFRLFRFRSPLLAESLICFLLLRVLRWFTSPGSLRRAYGFSARYGVFAPRGFPHSEIPGSQIACISPRLIAAGHVLLRLSSPRHPHACS
jgi:hypothetical protein